MGEGGCGKQMGSPSPTRWRWWNGDLKRLRSRGSVDKVASPVTHLNGLVIKRWVEEWRQFFFYKIGNVEDIDMDVDLRKLL